MSNKREEIEKMMKLNSLYNPYNRIDSEAFDEGEKIYTVDIERISPRTKAFRVQANSVEEAEERAMKLACNFDFNQQPSEDPQYHVLNITEEA